MQNEATSIGVNTESEIRRQRAEKLFVFLEKINAREVFGSEDDRVRFIQNAPVEQIKDILTRLNGIILDIPSRERELAAEVNMRLVNSKGGVDYVAPHSIFKEKLLDEVFAESKKITNSKDLGLLFSAEIQALHLFKDGNGRLARLVYLLFSKDHSFDENDRDEIINSLLTRVESKVKPYVAFIEMQTRQILAEQSAGMDFEDPEMPLALFTYDSHEELVKDIEARTDISENQKNMLDGIFEDEAYAVSACFKYFKSNGKDFRQFVQAFPWEDDLEVKAFITLDIIKSLTPQGVDELFMHYQGLKISYVRLLANMIVNPAEYPVDYKGAKTLKDAFVMCVEKDGIVEGQEV